VEQQINCLAINLYSTKKTFLDTRQRQKITTSIGDINRGNWTSNSPLNDQLQQQQNEVINVMDDSNNNNNKDYNESSLLHKVNNILKQMPKHHVTMYQRQVLNF